MSDDGKAYFEFIVDPGENAEFRFNIIIINTNYEDYLKSHCLSGKI